MISELTRFQIYLKFSSSWLQLADLILVSKYRTLSRASAEKAKCIQIIEVSQQRFDACTHGHTWITAIFILFSSHRVSRSQVSTLNSSSIPSHSSSTSSSSSPLSWKISKTRVRLPGLRTRSVEGIYLLEVSRLFRSTPSHPTTLSRLSKSRARHHLFHAVSFNNLSSFNALYLFSHLALSCFLITVQPSAVYLKKRHTLTQIQVRVLSEFKVVCSSHSYFRIPSLDTSV